MQWFNLHSIAVGAIICWTEYTYIEMNPSQKQKGDVNYVSRIIHIYVCFIAPHNKRFSYAVLNKQ